MDKHERPYKCTITSCKFKDFTNAGDLKRHQQQIHGNHGLPCPVSSCKRHHGKGFGRKDNLREHLKRIHGLEHSLASDEAESPPSEDRSPGSEGDDMMGGESQATVMDEAVIDSVVFTRENSVDGKAT